MTRYKKESEGDTWYFAPDIWCMIFGWYLIFCWLLILYINWYLVMIIHETIYKKESGAILDIWFLIFDAWYLLDIFLIVDIWVGWLFYCWCFVLIDILWWLFHETMYKKESGGGVDLYITRPYQSYLPLSLSLLHSYHDHLSILATNYQSLPIPTNPVSLSIQHSFHHHSPILTNPYQCRLSLSRIHFIIIVFI